MTWIATRWQVGLGVAVRQALDIGPSAAWERIRELADSLRGGLAGIPGVSVRDSGRLLCGLVSWTKVGVQPVRKDCQSPARTPLSLTWGAERFQVDMAETYCTTTHIP